jgi:DNA-binding MarR family transcriptional regulator
MPQKRKSKTRAADVPTSPKWHQTPGKRSDAWRHINVGRLLNNAVSRFETRVFELLAQAGHSEARLPHLNLTRNLDVAGTGITELARRAGVSKQAIGELIVDCERRGLVKRIPDPADARAKIVRFTDQGLEWLASLRAALDQAEREMRHELGTLRVDGLKAALKTYASAYDTLDRALGDVATPAERSR